ncbi:MAG: hypothetical protein LJE63_12580 [Desulfobacteraceae bacterium]|nr:hypothetical protein [Desulfobacteraceae bacterium]
MDEAHSSQTGETARKLKAILGASSVENGNGGDDEADWEDGLNQVRASHGRQPNLSFFAYTATPKGKTLELFGRTGPGGKPEPFHLCSLRQAIEERFILDVLQNYATCKFFEQIKKKTANTPEVVRLRQANPFDKFQLGLRQIWFATASCDRAMTGAVKTRTVSRQIATRIAPFYAAREAT